MKSGRERRGGGGRKREREGIDDERHSDQALYKGMERDDRK